MAASSSMRVRRQRRSLRMSPTCPTRLSAFALVAQLDHAQRRRRRIELAELHALVRTAELAQLGTLDLREALRDLAARELHFLDVLVRLPDVSREVAHALVEAAELDREPRQRFLDDVHLTT